MKKTVIMAIMFCLFIVCFRANANLSEKSSNYNNRQTNKIVYFALMVTKGSDQYQPIEVCTMALSYEQAKEKQQLWQEIDLEQARIMDKFPEPNPDNPQDFLNWRADVEEASKTRLNRLLDKFYAITGQLVNLSLNQSEAEYLERGCIFQRVFIESELIEDGLIRVYHNNFYKTVILP